VFCTGLESISRCMEANLYFERQAALKQGYEGLEAMPASIRLDEIADALEVQFGESSSYLDLDTGHVVTVS
jgi:hypothetical protein